MTQQAVTLLNKTIMNFGTSDTVGHFEAPGFVVEGQIVLILCGLIASGKVSKLLPVSWTDQSLGYEYNVPLVHF
jgi:hypothetical protein